MKKQPFLAGLSLLGLLVAMQVNAANVVDLAKIHSDDLKLSGSSFNSIITRSDKSRTIELNGQKNDLTILSSNVDKSGKLHTRYNQTYNGVPVWGRQVIHHQATNKGMINASGTRGKTKFTGQLVSDLDLDLAGVQPAQGFTSAKALEYAKSLYLSNKKNLNQSRLVYENESSELIIYTHSDDGKAKLAYRVSFFIDDVDGNQAARPTYLIDATTKELIQNWNSLMHERVVTGPGGNEKMGKHFYGEDKPKLDVRATKRGEVFFTNDKVRTVDLANGYWGARTFHFRGTENLEKEINGAYSPLNDAHYYGEQVFNLYQDWYDKAPLKFKLIMRVHYGKNYENAFWNGSSMTFGDGHSYFYPLVSIDVVGHEVSHGYTEQNSDLEYMGQSGGINESFSDMAGKAVEYYTFGRNTWGIGDDITKGKEPLRYMDEPQKDGRSIGDARDYNSWIDVHYSSGVFNKAFYLLATSRGWNLKKAFDVFVHANTYYWVPTTNFVDGALGAVYSAEDLGFAMNDIVDVFKKVGIECAEDSCSIMEKEQSNEDSNSAPGNDDSGNDESDSDSDSDISSV